MRKEALRKPRFSEAHDSKDSLQTSAGFMIPKQRWSPPYIVSQLEIAQHLPLCGCVQWGGGDESGRSSTLPGYSSPRTRGGFGGPLAPHDPHLSHCRFLAF